jgi:hypothetical protein
LNKEKHNYQVKMKRNTLIFADIALFVSIAAVSAIAHGPGWGWGSG